MDYRDNKFTLGALRREFYNRAKEIELLDDCIGEALTKRAVPITIALSSATYFAIRAGVLRNKSIFGMMRKNLLCMGIGVGASLIGIKSNYNDKLAIYYGSYSYQELRKMIGSEWSDKKSDKDKIDSFVQPDHLNLDSDRPHFEGIDTSRLIETNKDGASTIPNKYVTYEELQRINREKYAIKHTSYY